MHASVTMSEQDHFLAMLFVREATPTFLDKSALDLLASAEFVGPGRTYLVSGKLDALENLAWTMDRCVELIELDCSKCMTSCCDAFDHDYNLRLGAATRRFETEIENCRDGIDHDGDDERHDDDMVDCGPEYPRNDAGEWLGRM